MGGSSEIGTTMKACPNYLWSEKPSELKYAWSHKKIRKLIYFYIPEGTEL